MKLMKRISKIYNWSDKRTEGCINRSEHSRAGFFIRMRSRRGLTLAETMVSMSVFSMFMTVCCGSMVQYQTTFGRVERSMSYTEQLQAGLSMMVREISESNLSTFKDDGNIALIFPVDLSKSPVYFKLATSTNAHGDNVYDTNKISLSVNSKDQLVREEILPDGTVKDSKTIAVNVDKVVLSRLPEGSGYIPNALSILMTSTTTLSSKEEAMQNALSCPQGEIPGFKLIDGHKVHVCIASVHEPTGNEGELPLPAPADNNSVNSNERNYVTLQRVVRLNN